MAEKPKIETVLAHWIVDAASWREFVRAVRAYQQQRNALRLLLKLQDEPPASGVEVLIRQDSVSVGRETFRFDSLESFEVTLREGWLEFGNHYSDSYCHFPVPTPSSARGDAARVADHFTQQSAELARVAAEERARPTLSNRLLNLVEGNFVLAVLLFFFVLLPGGVYCFYLLSLWLDPPK